MNEYVNCNNLHFFFLEQVKNNAVLQASLERRKKALYVRRQALEKDVSLRQNHIYEVCSYLSVDLQVGLSYMNVLFTFFLSGGKTTRTVTAGERQEVSSGIRPEHVQRESNYSRNNR